LDSAGTGSAICGGFGPCGNFFQGGRTTTDAGTDFLFADLPAYTDLSRSHELVEIKILQILVLTYFFPSEKDFSPAFFPESI